MKRILAFVLGTSIALGAIPPAPANAARKPVTVTVSSTTGWQDTGLSLQAGDHLVVAFVSGGWTVDHRNFPHVGPDGYRPHVDAQIWPGCKLQGIPYGKLLASVDQVNLTVVGAGGAFSVKQSGPLRLRINDGDACLGDNAGSVKVTLARITGGVLRAIEKDVAELQRTSRAQKPFNILSALEMKNITPILKRLEANVRWLAGELINDAAWELVADAMRTSSVLKLKQFLNPCFSLDWKVFLTSKECLKLWSLPTKTIKA